MISTFFYYMYTDAYQAKWVKLLLFFFNVYSSLRIERRENYILFIFKNLPSQTYGC